MVTESYMQGIQQSTKAILDAQPQREIRLMAARKGELNFEIVGVNGYNFQIQRGVAVKVPQTVYDILVEANLI
jgi:hypothetical protein